MIKPFRLVLFLSTLCFGAAICQATVITFSGALPLGNLPQSVSVAGVGVSAFEVAKTNGTSWMNTAILNNRNEGAEEFGLGVCADASNCPATGNGSINEIDNNGSTFDVIRLDFGGVVLLNSVTLSSLDSGAKDGFAIFGAITAQPDLSVLTPLAQGTNQSVGSVSPAIAVNQDLRYLFIAPQARGVNDSGSDFLLWKVNEGGAATPEPLTIVLVGLGLVAIGLVGRNSRLLSGQAQSGPPVLDPSRNSRICR